MIAHPSFLRTLLAALLASLAVFAISAGAASAAAPVAIAPSTFEGGDGNTAVNGASPATDWASPAPNLTQKTDVDSGPDPSAFVTGSKEQDPGNWDLGVASAPSKADILHAAFANEVVGGDLFFYGAFERLDGSGNANVSFELNAVPGTFNNGNDQVPIRSEGDLLITFDGNNANGVRVGMCIWHGDRNGESSSASDASSFGWYTLPSGSTPGKKLKGSDNCTTLSTVSSPTATGAMNNGTLSVSGLSEFSSSIADNRFGEMSVNVSQALENAGIVSPCLDFGSAWIHSRSSDAPLSSMQDYVGPSNIHAATPCSIDLEKSVAVEKQGTGVTGSYFDADTAGSAPVANTGDTLHYLVTVTNPGQNDVTLLNDPPSDNKCTLALVSKVDKNGAPDGSTGTLNPGDVWTYSCTHPFGDTQTDGNLYTNTASVVGAVGSPTGCTITSSAPCVHDTDPANVVRAGTVEIQKVNVDGAASDQFTFGTSNDLDGSDFTLQGGQTKVYDHVVPNDGGGLTYTVNEKDLPIGYRLTDLTCTDSNDQGTASTVDESTATATINVESGETVHCTFTNTFTAPGIAIDKTGPASATAGDLLPYTLTVTNPGQESLAASTVVVTDQQCTSAPVLQAKNTGSSPDQTPDSLDPGDTWIYTCSGQTAAGQSSFTNTACVSGTDVFGRNVSACDSVITTLGQIVVAGERVEPGTARIAGATGCVARRFNVVVRGTQISRVEFRIDGKKRATLHKPDSKGRYILRVDPKKFKPGSHLLVAKSVFTAASNTPAKSLRLRFARCVRRTAPAFTG